MKTKIQILMTAVFILICVYPVHLLAQVLAPTDVNASVTSIGNDSSTATCFVSLADTANIQEIQVQLGNNDDLHNLVNYNFLFDVTTGLPPDFSYSRVGNKVKLDVGSFSESPTLFGQVRIKSTNGQWSDYFKFIAN